MRRLAALASLPTSASTWSGRDEGPYGFVNSIAREVALDLSGEGIETEFRYPDDDAISTPGSAY